MRILPGQAIRDSTNGHLGRRREKVVQQGRMRGRDFRRDFLSPAGANYRWNAVYFLTMLLKARKNKYCCIYMASLVGDSVMAEIIWGKKRRKGKTLMIARLLIAGRHLDTWAIRATPTCSGSPPSLPFRSRVGS
jgi:hypothetical protein